MPCSVRMMMKGRAAPLFCEQMGGGGCYNGKTRCMMDVVLRVFDNALKTVERVMKVQRAEVMASNKEVAADARCLLVWVLSEDLTDGEIARCMGVTRQAVNGIRNGARMRIKGRRVLQVAEQEIRKELARE